MWSHASFRFEYLMPIYTHFGISLCQAFQLSLSSASQRQTVSALRHSALQVLVCEQLAQHFNSNSGIAMAPVKSQTYVYF